MAIWLQRSFIKAMNREDEVAERRSRWGGRSRARVEIFFFFFIPAHGSRQYEFRVPPSSRMLVILSWLASLLVSLLAPV